MVSKSNVHTLFLVEEIVILSLNSSMTESVFTLKNVFGLSNRTLLTSLKIVPLGEEEEEVGEGEEVEVEGQSFTLISIIFL
jgi:hypothetical protein